MAPLVIIVGPTASGKTAVAIQLAKKFDGEIICADSRTIYKGMDIGTAKPTAEEQAVVPHWGLDLVEPGERFSAAAFKAYATEKIADIHSRGKVPFLVGGSGLYIDSVVLDYQFTTLPDVEKRNKLEEMNIEQLHAYCNKNNIIIPENSQNKRYVINAIERHGLNISSNDTPIDNSIIVGIATEKEVLRKRIQQRSTQLFARGMVEEADQLATRYGWESEAMTANIYRLVHEYRLGTISEAELARKNELADWHLAKRQLTWFKRRKFIHWLPLEQVVEYVSDRLTPS